MEKYSKNPKKSLSQQKMKNLKAANFNGLEDSSSKMSNFSGQ